MKINEKELKEIFDGIRKNEETSFNKLYEKYNKLIYSITFSILKNKEDAEDVTQAVFSKIYEIDKQKLPIKHEASWLYTITKNETITYLRKRKNELNIEEIYNMESTDSSIEEVCDKETYERLISKLTQKEKETISLKILGGLSFKEISKLVKEPTNTTKWRYYKAIHTLELLLANLSLFIITFIFAIQGVFTKKELKDESIENQEKIEDKEDNLQDVINNVSEETKKDKEDKREEANEEISKSEGTDKIETDTVIIDTVQSFQKEEIYIKIGLICTSVIFFILTIILLVSQIKHKIIKNKRE